MTTSSWFFTSIFFFAIWTGIAICLKGCLWPLGFFWLCLSFDQLVLPDSYSSWVYRICFGSLLSSSLFKWPAHLRVCWASIWCMRGSLDFFKMNLFGICCYQLSFSNLCKRRIIVWLIGQSTRISLLFSVQGVEGFCEVDMLYWWVYSAQWIEPLFVTRRSCPWFLGLSRMHILTHVGYPPIWPIVCWALC